MNQKPNNIFFRHMVVGPIQTNCYIIADIHTKNAIVIDPGSDAEKILNEIRNNDLNLVYIINTHAHIDHTAANKYIKESTGADILIGENEAPLLIDNGKNLAATLQINDISPSADRVLYDNESITLGSLNLKVINTPGHTPGGICLLSKGFVFTGDTLFCQGLGRTDLPGGSEKDLHKSIKMRLFSLDDNLIIYPGHGNFSTIGQEKQTLAYL